MTTPDTLQQELEVITAIYGKRDGAFSVDMNKVKRVVSLIAKREVASRIEELKYLEETAEWGDFKGDGINARANIIFTFRLVDRIAELSAQLKENT